MRERLPPVLVVLALLAGACSAEVHAELSVDGSPFQVRTCRAGEPLGFFGIELRAFDERRLRLVTRSDGAAEAVLFGAGSATGTSLGPCGPLTYQRSGVEVNHVEAVKGDATLSCKAAGHELTGTIRFEDCAG